MNFSTNINTIFEIHDPQKLKFLKFFFEQKICLIFMIKEAPLFFFEGLKMEYLWPILIASEAPCTSISKNQMKSLKPGHQIAKILLLRPTIFKFPQPNWRWYLCSCFFARYFWSILRIKQILKKHVMRCWKQVCTYSSSEIILSHHTFQKP